MNTLLGELIDNKVVKGKKVVFDATFIKAYSKRDIHDNSRGGSDPEARVGRNGKTYELGYKLHLAVDAKSELPLAVTVPPANDNEKKHAPELQKNSEGDKKEDEALGCVFAILVQGSKRTS
jgi:transposase, IS5 family